MKSAIDLAHTPVRQCFHHYLMPAVFGLLTKSLFIFGDSLIIGQGIGEDALAAMALAIPFFAFFTALAMMIGIGGAATMSIQLGRGDKASAQPLFNQSMQLSALMVTALVIPLLIWIDPIVHLMGARGDVAVYTQDYLVLLLMLMPVYSLTWVLSCFVRNDANPRLAMIAMVAGSIINLGMDYVFIMLLDMGIKGAVYALACAQVGSIAIMSRHFRGGQHLQLRWTGWGLNHARRILGNGLPVFFVEASMAVTVLLFNLTLVSLGGQSYLTAYGIVSSVGVIVWFTLLGIGQACQPIISYNFGARALERIQSTFKLGVGYASLVGLAALVAIPFYAEEVAGWFVLDNPALVSLTGQAMILTFLAYPLMAFNLVSATLFQSIERPVQASIISLARGFVFVVLGLILLPVIWPDNGIWLTPLFAEVLTLGLSVYYLRRKLPSMHSVREFDCQSGAKLNLGNDLAD